MSDLVNVKPFLISNCTVNHVIDDDTGRIAHSFYYSPLGAGSSIFGDSAVNANICFKKFKTNPASKNDVRRALENDLELNKQISTVMGVSAAAVSPTLGTVLATHCIV